MYQNNNTAKPPPANYGQQPAPGFQPMPGQPIAGQVPVPGAGGFCARCNTSTPDAVSEDVSVLGWVLCVLTFPIGLLCLLCCKKTVGKCTVCGTNKWERDA